LTQHQATVGHFRDYNPTIQSWVYALDLYQFQNEVGGLPESSFLHVSEPTSVTLKDINGNVLADYTIPAGGRFEAAVWMNKNWPFNMKDANLRAYDSNRILDLVGSEAGVFLDAHGSGFSDTFKIGFQTIINSGGGIQEYGGLRPGDPRLDAAYGADMLSWLTQLHGDLAAAGKWGILNQATNFAYDPMSREQAIAIGGFQTENLIAPDSLRGADSVWNLYDLTQRVTANQGNAIITGKWNFQPANYTSGSYGSGEARNDMWRLSFYYLVKESAGSSGKTYFDLTLPSYMTNDIPSDQSRWYAAYQFDVGQPTGGMTVAQTGTSPSDGAPYTVFSRSYTNAKVLFRPMDQWSSTNYGDGSAVTVQLNGNYRQLREDATLGPVTNSVQIRNAEALILVPTSTVASNVVATPAAPVSAATPVSTAPAPVVEPTPMVQPVPVVQPTPVSAEPTPVPIATSPLPAASESKTVAEMLALSFPSNESILPTTPPAPVISQVVVPDTVLPTPVAPAAPVTPEPVTTTSPPPATAERSFTVTEMLAMDWTTR
jgi:hypothetical protein